MTKQVRVTVCYIVLIAFVAAVIGTFAWATGGFKNWNAATWFDYWGKGAPTVITPKPDIPDAPDKGGSLMTDVSSNGIKLDRKQLSRTQFAAMGIAEHADSAYTLTATVEPANASDKTVTFGAAWNDASSAWATGKTLAEYVTLTVDGNTATVTCLQAFGETVRITCTSRDSVNINAVCTLDYAKRITSLGAVLEVKDGMPPHTQLTEKGLDSYPFLSHHYYGLAFTPEYSIGTVDDKFEYTGYFEKTSYSSGKYTGGIERWEVPTNLVFSDSAMLDEMFSLSPPGTQYFYDMCSQALANNVGIVRLNITASGEYSEYTTWYELRVNKDSFKVNVTDVTLSQGSLVF